MGDNLRSGGSHAVRVSATPESIALRLGACSPDELRVIDQVLSGLERGRDVYGPLDVAADARDFSLEASDELRDCLVYLAAHHIAQTVQRRERMECETADRITAAFVPEEAER